MLINLSNHSTSKWSENQVQLATKQYGKIVDMPFPSVPPEAGYEEVRVLALDIVNSICNKYINEKLTIHIMGEQTFVYAAVQEFHKKGMECIASTAERRVSFLADGEKVSQFQFVRFRAY